MHLCITSVIFHTAMQRHSGSHLAAQGPPGTGKTHTIVAIASAVLLGDDGGGSVPSQPATNRNSAVRRDEGRPPPRRRLLVCAQSNAAVDELIARLTKQVPATCTLACRVVFHARHLHRQ